MNRQQKAKQIEKLLSKLIFEKRDIEIDVEPISDAQHKTAGYPSWRKYVVNIHVNPFKFNDMTKEFSQEYFDFILNLILYYFINSAYYFYNYFNYYFNYYFLRCFN